MRTYHTNQLPAGVVGRPIKKAVITEETKTIPSKVEGEEPTTVVKKITTYTPAFRVRLTAREARKHIKAGVALVPAC